MSMAANIIQDVINSCRFDKDGERLVEGLVRLHLAQSKANREEFVKVYRNWIKSGDSIHADWAISLIRRLKLIDELPLLKSILEEINIGQSRLPTYFCQFLAPAIDELKNASTPQGSGQNAE